MKHRTWITEALRLHFEEHLPRVVAGRRLGVPKSTVCSMFVRFRRAGLSWPLPAGMSEQELDACLYGQFSTVPVVRPESTVTWITEALRLHFEEHLPRVVAGRRLGVPKSTVCSMFVRFRRAGLSWPLPAGMSEQELDACLYGQFSTVPVVRPESTVISEAPVVKKRPRRPNFPYEFKIALVEQSLQPGACVAQIARE
uniref:IS66-like element accessory protein TnpA n=1 Tax=Escherichia coli TaxID=562 RepID=UPI000A6EC1C5